MPKRVWIWLLALGLSGCQGMNKDPAADFYYWKSTFSPGAVEQSYMDRLQTKRLFVRLFDVDLAEDGSARPVGTLSGLDTTGITPEIIPVVFITNRTFLQLQPEDTDHLARRIDTRIEHMAERAGIQNLREIQIDCDWTAGTREAYFRFLKSLQQHSGKKVTATLRLHQVKFRDNTGVPPVNKVYLMCYATSSPLEKDPGNSILDIALLKDYLGNINDYPLAFDIALPLYSWAIVRNHLDEVRLLNGVTSSDLSQKYFQRQTDGLYLVKQDVFLNGMYLNTGFRLKVERITPGLLKKAQRFLKNHVESPYRLVYFHLDAEFLQRFAIPDLKL